MIKPVDQLQMVERMLQAACRMLRKSLPLSTYRTKNLQGTIAKNKMSLSLLEKSSLYELEDNV